MGGPGCPCSQCFLRERQVHTQNAILIKSDALRLERLRYESAQGGEQERTSPLRGFSTKTLILVDPDRNVDKLARVFLQQFAEQLSLPCVECGDRSMTDQNRLATRGRRFDDPSQRIKSTRKHYHTIRYMKWPV